MESYSVETMSGSFLSKFCMENWGDCSLKSSRGSKTSHPITVLLFFSSSISQPLSTPFGWANYKTVPNIKLQTACMSFKFRARDMGDLPKYAAFYVESHCDLKNAP